MRKALMSVFLASGFAAGIATVMTVHLQKAAAAGCKSSECLRSACSGDMARFCRHGVGTCLRYTVQKLEPACRQALSSQ